VKEEEEKKEERKLEHNAGLDDRIFIAFQVGETRFYRLII